MLHRFIGNSDADVPAHQIEVVLPSDFSGTLVVHNACKRPHLGNLLALDARRRNQHSTSAAIDSTTVYDVQPRAVVMALLYQSAPILYGNTIEEGTQLDICEVFAGGAAVCLRYAAETGSQDMRDWYENVLSPRL